MQVAVSEVGVDMEVVPVGVEQDGFMELPDAVKVAGWYRYAAAADASEGTIVLASHVDLKYQGLGPFARLRDLAQGDEVRLTAASGTQSVWKVDSVTQVGKRDLPVDELFARTGPKRLAMITCGGEFDRSIGRYEDNIVVVASPVG